MRITMSDNFMVSDFRDLLHDYRLGATGNSYSTSPGLAFSMPGLRILSKMALLVLVGFSLDDRGCAKAVP
jgi:hypothetical protein